MKKQTKIILIMLISFIILAAGGVAYYVLEVYEEIEQKVSEVTLSYTQEAQRNSSYYFEGQRSEEDFDAALFQFDDIKDYDVVLTFRDEQYHVTFHVIDDQKPVIDFMIDRVDLYQGFELNELYAVHDKSKVDVDVNMKEEDFSVGEQELCVTATDASNNTLQKCQIITVEDSTPRVDVSTAVSFDYDYKNMTLEQILNDYRNKRGLTTQIAISYHNFVTQETYFVNPDQWMVAGSTYKLPLNMYYYELENAGQISPDKKLKYNDYSFEEGGPVGDSLYKPGDEIAISELHYYSLVYSDNTASRILFDGLGGWGTYREAVKKYSTNTTYTNAYYSNNFCVRYINDVLTYLYQNYGNFADLENYLFTVPDSLKRYVYVPILQKDGCYGSAYNSAGIVFADKPYAAAVYTSLGESGPNVIGEINLLLYNYSQAH